MKKLITAFFVFVSAVCFAELPPLTIITTNAVGSQIDTVVRYLAPAIEKELQRSVVVMNMPGADGLIAMQKFSSMPADGNTLLGGGASISFATVADRDYKPQDHFKPLMGLVQSEYLLLVPRNSKITNIKSLITVAKEKGGIMGGSSGAASTLSFALIQEQLGINITPVEYKQNAQIALDLAAGDRTDIAIAGAGNAAIRSFVSSGELRPIAVIGHSPSTYFKDVKTITQQGYKSVEDFGWSGLFVQNGVPESVKNKLFAGITAAMKSAHGANFEKLLGEPRLFFATGAEITELQKREAIVYKEKAPQIVR
jgi:tripartite-type tricarboxylate transporter receptor subunit TctC